MEMTLVVRSGIIILGIAAAFAGFWFHSIRKLTVNFGVIWSGLGILLIVLGVAFPDSLWRRMFPFWQGVPFLFLGILLLIGGFCFSIQVSKLLMKNREMAMRLSLLIEEKEQLKIKLEEISGQHEKNAVGY